MCYLPSLPDFFLNMYFQYVKYKNAHIIRF